MSTKPAADPRYPEPRVGAASLTIDDVVRIARRELSI